MPNLLTVHNLKEVHFVDRGAAVGARVLFLKRATETAMPQKDSILQAIGKALDNVFKGQPEPHPIAKAIDEFVAKADPATLAGMDPEKLLEQALSAVKDEATKAAIMAAVGALYRAQPPKPSEAKPEEKPAEAKPEEKPAEAKPEEKLAEPPVAKSLEEVMKAHKEATDKIVALEKRLADSDKTVAEEIAKRELSAEVEIAKSFTFVPGDIPSRAALLLSVRKGQGEKAYENLVGSFKSANELISKSLPVTKGTSAQGTDEDDPKAAYAILKQKADEIVQKSAGKITPAKALIKAGKENPDLYAKARQ